MFRSIRLVALAALLALLLPDYASAGKAPVPDGPNKLDDCGCGPIYKTMLKCQAIKVPKGKLQITDCICIPNPNGWYGYFDDCRDCLAGSGFFGGLASMITQMFTSCTNTGGNVLSDGQSICATNAMWELCTSLKDGSKGQLSWTSFEKFSDPSENTNATQLLNIEVPQENGTSTDTAAPKTTTTAAAATGTSSLSTTTALQSTATTAATGTGTGTSRLTATTASQSTKSTAAPSSAAGLGYRSQVGRVLGSVMAAVGCLLV